MARSPDAALSKSALQRKSRVEAGMLEYSAAYLDLLKHGLASFESSAVQDFERLAARMVDLQAGGFARILRELKDAGGNSEQKLEQIASRLSCLQMAASAYLEADSLDNLLRKDLQTLIGFTVKQSEVLESGRSKRDGWQVCGRRVEIEEKLKVQRTWLQSESGVWALILDFAHGREALSARLEPGTFIFAELAFYDSSFPLRALLKSSDPDKSKIKSFQTACSDYDQFLDDYANAVARNPFIERFPLLINNMKAVFDGNEFLILDRNHAYLPHSMSIDSSKQILALSGSNEFTLFAEYDGKLILPLSILVAERFYTLSPGLRPHYVA